MKLLKNTFALSFSFLLIFSSCSIEKRQHTKGYYVNWNSSYNSTIKKESKLIQSNSEEFVLAQTSTNTKEISTPIFEAKSTKSNSDKRKKFKQKIEKNAECDVIILKNGTEIQAKVIEIGEFKVKYKNCDNLTGPTFYKNKSEIFMVKYPNGTSTIIENKEEPSASQASNNNSSNSIVNNNMNQNDNSNDRSFLVTVLLWFFLGAIGIHRFYLGHTGMAILYLLTGGLCGIGWLIDGILLLTGGLKPKNGKYIK
jgi:TM2 domain-containing membrane protein YozV